MKYFATVGILALILVLSAFGGAGTIVQKESKQYKVIEMDYVYDKNGETMGMSVVGEDSNGDKVMFLDNTNYIDVGDEVLVTYEKGTYGEVILAVREVGQRD